MSRTLSEISTDLRRLPIGFSAGDKALRQLADQLAEPDATNLTGVDLAAIYDPDVMLPEGTPGQRRFANGLELLRDVLIFVPVIYTWWQIATALRAYDQYTGRAPFLLAWQQGFGNRTEPLSTSATVVAVVVLAVIFCTVVAHAVRGRYELGVQQRQQRLAVLLGEASMWLARTSITESAGVSRADIAKISTKIVSSSRALQDALSRTGRDITSAVNTNPGSKLHEMFEQWTAAAHELTALGTRLQDTQDTVADLRATQTALSGMAAGIATETQKLITALETERSLSRQEAHAHHELAAEVGQSTKVLGDSLRGLNDRAEQFSELILRLDYVVKRLDAGGGYQ